MLRKSPFSLPRDEYGGARKRTFIGLMLGSCLLLCLLLFVFLILPWSFGGIPDKLPALAVGLGLAAIAVLLWLCLSLIFHIYTGRRPPGLRSVRRLTVRLFLPLMELLARLVGIDKARVRRSFIKVNNELVLSDRKAVEPSRLLLLLPHCVQRSTCPYRLTYDVDNCRRCGSCPVGALLDLRDKYGVRLSVATGGTIARRIVVESRPTCIVAVACERDLTSGIQDSYPLPVFGVLNERPCGPCLDTLVPLDRLEAAVRVFLNLPPQLADLRGRPVSPCATHE